MIQFNMKKECLNCQKEYQSERAKSKFCSNNCRVKWHRSNSPVQKEKNITKFQLQVLYNSIKDLIDKAGNLSFPQNSHLNHNVSSDFKETEKYNKVQEPLSFDKINKEKVDSAFEYMKKKILSTEEIWELENAMRDVNSSGIIWREKKLLEDIAKNHAENIG